jgi:ATP-binding cassette subfamily B protein
MKDLLNILGRPYKKKYLPFAIGAILFMLLDVGIALLIPRITESIFTHINKEVFDIALDSKVVIRTGIFAIAIAIFAVGTTVMNNIFAQYLSTKITSDIRKELFMKIQDLSFANVDNITTARLMTTVSNDTSQVQQIIMMSFRAILRAPLTFIGAIVMAYITNADLFIVILISAPILGFAIFKILKNASKIFSSIQIRLDNLNSKLHETVSGAREIKSFVSELDEIDRFDDVNDKFMETNIKVHKLMSLLDPAIVLVSNFAIATVLYISANIAFKGSNPELVGNISAYIAYLQQIIMSLMMLSMIAMIISRGEVSARRINLVLNTVINITNAENPKTSEIKGEIEYKNVSFGYGDEEGSDSLTLKNISFKIPAKSTVGVIGSTGSGKTSLIQLLPRLYDVKNGEVLIDGVNVKEYDLGYLRNQISFVTQEAIIFSGTIKSNIIQGKEDATDEEIAEAAKNAVADEFIENLENKYDSVVNQGGTNLSGGQKQRLALARALVRKPKIIILDDSTSAVDAKSEALIKDNLSKLANQTTIIVAQKISSIINCDYTIVLNNVGELDGFGSHEELLETSNVYREIYNSQLGGAHE